MRNGITVSTASRLHLGFLDLNGGLGRRFGSFGLAIDAPETSIELSGRSRDAVEGPQAERAAAYLASFVAGLSLPEGHRLVVHEAIPAHAGLGSGTQMALAIGSALRRLHGLAADPQADAALAERSARSGLGLCFFLEGGIALDGGRRDNGGAAPVIARLPVPRDWRILLILDPARRGVHGAEELAVFRSLPPFPAELAAHLCRLVVMQALPAAADGDLPPFARAVTEIQAHVGDYFSAAQGGRYASPAVAAVLDLLARNGAAGYGQSSWGPTGFALAATPAEAERWLRLATPLAKSSGLEMMIVKGRGHGAVVAGPARASRQGVSHG